MSETITVTSEDISRLANRLDQLEGSFSVEERAILLAVFSLASEAITRRAEDGAEVSGFVQPLGATALALNLGPDLPGLGTAFENSFLPGPAGSVRGREDYVPIIEDVIFGR